MHEPGSGKEGRELAVPVAVMAAIVYGLLLYVYWFWPDSDGKTFAFLGILFTLPAVTAIVAVILADPDGQKTPLQHATIGVKSIFGAILLAVVFLREGGFCAVIAAPVYLIISPASAQLTGWVLRRIHARTLLCLPILLPLIAWPLDAFFRYPERIETVVTSIEIAAPPSTVWKNTVNIRRIAPEEMIWTFTHSIAGAPKPIEARLDGEGVGAVRHLRWDQNVHFQEHVTAWQEDSFFSWSFRFKPDSIPLEVERHIRVDSDYLHFLRGQYSLEPLPDGRTRLILTTEYKLATPINGYAAWWGRVYLDDFHSAVLEVIRGRAEAEARLELNISLSQ